MKPRDVVKERQKIRNYVCTTEKILHSEAAQSG